MTPAEVDERTPGDVPVYSVGTLVSPTLGGMSGMPYARVRTL